MRLLLDTHVFVWSINRPSVLPSSIRSLLADRQHSITISVATIWEIAIKRPLGRMNAPAISSSEAIDVCALAGFEILDISAAHAAAVEKLPLLHGDPFDRLLVAQALVEPMRLVTHDARLAAYSDTIITF